MLAKLPVVKVLAWAVAGLLALVLALSAGLALQGFKHKAAIATLDGHYALCTAELATADEGLDALVATDARKTLAIADLAHKLDVAIHETERLDELAQRAEDELSGTRAARDAALTRAAALREKTYATDQSCAAWGAAAVCGRVTDGLQVHWRAAANRRQ